MDTSSVLLYSAKLLTWMRANLVDEPEPRLGGVPLSTVLSQLTAGGKVTDPADKAALALAGTVLDQRAKHKHATSPAPPPF